MHACGMCACSHGRTFWQMQLDARLAERDWRWHCERFFSLALGGGDVELFFIDTSPGVASYAKAPWAVNAGAGRPSQLSA